MKSRHKQNEIYQKVKGIETRWISFENPTGAKGAGGKSNKGAKGNAYEVIKPFETKVLCDIKGFGIINRLWMTLGALDPSLPQGVLPSSNISPRLLRSMRIEMFWDDAATPAVSAPLGDFFGTALSLRTSFESALFSDPEGRSFCSYAKMPFRKRARITITNDGEFPATLILYYKISCSFFEQHEEDILYFHAYWRRSRALAPGVDFTILPKIHGEGRYLGANLGVMINPVYGGTWWGEGEVKLYLDGDKEYPTLVGTGAEDYPGSGYGLDKFIHLYQGCTYNQGGLVAFYRYHMDDPVFFYKECKVDIQAMGSAFKRDVLKFRQEGAPIAAVSGIRAADNNYYPFLEEDCQVQLGSDELGLDDYVCYYRQDDWCATAYFYLDRPENGLPPIAGCAERMDGIPERR